LGGLLVAISTCLPRNHKLTAGDFGATEAFDRSTLVIGFGRVLNTKAEHNDRHHRASLAVIGDRECCMLPPPQGALAMSNYKAYLISRDGHHIRAVDLECVDDDSAKRLAEQLTDFSNVELWEHARKVAKFGSKSD
jgi:hypothetical protein